MTERYKDKVLNKSEELLIENLGNVKLISPTDTDTDISNTNTVTIKIEHGFFIKNTLEIIAFDITTNPQILFTYNNNNNNKFSTLHLNYFNQLVHEQLDPIKRPLNITNMIEFAYRFINHKSFIDEIIKSGNYTESYKLVPIVSRILNKYLIEHPQTGGKSAAKVLIFGRKRNVIMKGRAKYVKYKGVLQKLSELRKLEKTKH